MSSVLALHSFEHKSGIFRETSATTVRKQEQEQAGARARASSLKALYHKTTQPLTEPFLTSLFTKTYKNPQPPVELFERSKEPHTTPMLENQKTCSDHERPSLETRLIAGLASFRAPALSARGPAGPRTCRALQWLRRG